jgi:sulfite reductase (ferredoxin)
MSFYTLPSSLAAEIDELENQIGQFQNGRLDPTAFKARRVPFGIYEQRKGNTYMVRVRCPGGAITPRQFRVLAELSQAYAADTLHITSRQELQLHDVALENAIPILRRLFEAGLSTRGGGGNTVRNITASADSGVARDEAFDVGPYAFALTDKLIGEPDSWLLPRKYKIAFSNSERDSARAIFNDLGFLAVTRNGVRGFAVYVAGGMGSKPQVGHLLHEFVAESEVFFIAEAIKRLFHQHGNRKNRYTARLRFLWNSLGEERFLALYREERDELRRQAAAALVLPPPLAAPAAVGGQSSGAGAPDFELWRRRFVAEQKQPGLHTVLVPIAFGNLPNNHALSLADFLIPRGEDVLRATIEQNLHLRNIPGTLLGQVFDLVTRITALASEPRLLGSMVACTGAATCKLGVCLPRGALAATMQRLKESRLDLDRLSDFRINVSGCSNSCGAHLTADLGFFGRVARVGQTPYPAYEVVAGGTLGHGMSRLAEGFGTIAAHDLPAFVTDFLSRYLDQKPAFSGFREYFEKQGRQDLLALCDKYRNVPSFEDDKNYYFDWGATDQFSLAGRGVAECSAGMFDLIEVDRKRLKELRQHVENITSADRADSALYEMALSAARMLLITRGVEAGSEAAVFSLFRRHFVDAGLVDVKYLPLLDIAERKDFVQLRKLAHDVLALAQTMDGLYGKMDTSLRFPGETAAARPAGKSSPDPVEARDFRGVACPMNFVKTKLALEGLSAGQRLRILLDDGPPIQNVPRSVAEEGHRVVEQVKTGNHWAVVIEKR